MRACLLVCLLLAVAGVCVGTAQAANLDVFAAASLSEYVKSDLKPAFERAHRGVTVRPNVAASSELRIQIEQGAPADVFMSADTMNTDALAAKGLVTRPAVFAFNSLVFITPKSNPARIASLRDLSRPRLKLVVAAPATPIGKYTRMVVENLSRSGQYGKGYARAVLANVVSQEPNVKGVVAKVQLGEADGGFCYVSDVTPEVRSRVKVIPIPAKQNIRARYPLAVVNASRQKALAQEFVKLVLSPRGQAMLARHGLLPVKAPAPKGK